MAKGIYYPELLAIHTYSWNPRETLAFLQCYTDSLRLGLIDLKSGHQAHPIRLDGHADDLDRAIAFGGMIHEYVHHLQYTSRAAGLMFFECRHQQALWTHRCLDELRNQRLPVSMPLMEHAQFSRTDGSILSKWREQWVSYQGSIALSGLGTWFEVETDFPQYMVREYFATNRDSGLCTPDGVDASEALSWSSFMGAEAHIVATDILRETFPEVWLDACVALGAGNVTDEGRLSADLQQKGLSPLIPLLCDYCMQVSFGTIGKMATPQMLFTEAIGAVEKKYAGIDHHALLKNRGEILRTIEQTVGSPPLEEVLTGQLDAFNAASVAETPLGHLLRKSLTFRMECPTFFVALHAFIVLIMRAFPVPVWMYFNNRPLPEADRPVGFQLGKLEFGTEHVIYQRLFLWAAREFALRQKTIICPECHLKGGRESCSGDCMFTAICRDEYGYDPCKRTWAEDNS